MIPCSGSTTSPGQRASVSGASYLAPTGWAIADIVPPKVKGMDADGLAAPTVSNRLMKRGCSARMLTGWAMQNAGHPVTADYLGKLPLPVPNDKVDEALWGGS